MVRYECDRCGYSSLLKPNFIKHLNRKYICKVKKKDISIDLIKKSKLVWTNFEFFDCFIEFFHCSFYF